MRKKVIGYLRRDIAEWAGSRLPEGEITISETNVLHMKDEHPGDFDKYFACLEEILAAPNYIGVHPTRGGIEFIKKFEEYVLVAIQPSKFGTMYARSLYIIEKERVELFVRKGRVKNYPPPVQK